VHVDHLRPIVVSTCPQETKLVFEKLFKFIGKNIKALVDRPDDPHCFRLQKNRVYYVRETLMKKATNVSGYDWSFLHAKTAD
jgi:ribosome biogenesis protein Nip4